MIAESTLEEIRRQADLVAVVERHVTLAPANDRNFKGRCPFHRETSPSFFVFSERRTFQCFGCQSKGDVIDFVSRLTRASHDDAAKRLAIEFNIPWVSA